MDFKKRIITLKKPLTQKQITNLNKFMENKGKNNKNKIRCCVSVLEKELSFYWVVGELDSTEVDAYIQGILKVIG